MLTITVPGDEMFDESDQTFVRPPLAVLELEHSLVSLSKWESIYEKPFLSREDKTPEELFSYIRCMLLTPNVSDDLLGKLSVENMESINEYINRKMTATWFNDPPGTPKTRDIITAELIYYWMTSFQIPFECENWHLNRLFTLIRICNIKSAKPKKMSRSEVAARNRELNAKRKAEMGSTG